MGQSDIGKPKKKKKINLLGIIDFSFKSSILTESINKIKEIGFDYKKSKRKKEISENGSMYDDLYLSKVKKALIEVGVNHPDKVKLLIEEFEYMSEKIAAMLIPVKRALTLLAIYIAKEFLLGYLMKISDQIGGGNLSSIDTSSVQGIMNTVSLDQIFGGVSSMISFLILIILFIIVIYIIVSLIMHLFQSVFYKQQFIRMVLIELYYRYEKIVPSKSINGYYKDLDINQNEGNIQQSGNPYNVFDGSNLTYGNNEKIILDNNNNARQIKRLDSKDYINEKLDK